MQKKIEEEKAGRDNRANQLNPNHKEYKHKAVFFRLSKAGGHLFVHDSEGNLEPGVTLIVGVSELQAVIEGKRDWAKVGVLPSEEEE